MCGACKDPVLERDQDFDVVVTILLRLSLGRAKVGALRTGFPLSLLKLLQVVEAQLVQRVTGTNNHLVGKQRD